MKKRIAVLAIALIGMVSIPQIANAKKPAWCDEALEECRGLRTGFVFWDIGIELGCAIGYANCG